MVGIGGKLRASNIPESRRGNVGMASCHPAVRTWKNRYVANSGAVSAIAIAATDKLVKYLEGTGTWERTTLFWHGVGDWNAAAALLKSPSASTMTFSNVSSGDYSESLGITFPAGTTNYADTGLNPSTHLTSNTVGTMFGYCHNTGTREKPLGGCYDGSNMFALYPAYIDNTAYWRCYDLSGGQLTASSSDAKGMFIARRASATSSVITKNKTSLGSNSSSGGSRLNANVYMANLNGALGSPNQTIRISTFGVGEAFTATDDAVLNDGYSAFAGRIGRAL